MPSAPLPRKEKYKATASAFPTLTNFKPFTIWLFSSQFWYWCCSDHQYHSNKPDPFSSVLSLHCPWFTRPPKTPSTPSLVPSPTPFPRVCWLPVTMNLFIPLNLSSWSLFPRLSSSCLLCHNVPPPDLLCLAPSTTQFSDWVSLLQFDLLCSVPLGLLSLQAPIHSLYIMTPFIIAVAIVE